MTKYKYNGPDIHIPGIGNIRNGDVVNLSPSQIDIIKTRPGWEEMRNEKKKQKKKEEVR